MTERDRRFGVALATTFVLVVIAALAAALAGCAVGPEYVKPDRPVARKFAPAAGPYSADEARARFWTQFGDATIDRLVDEALAANHDLRIALSHLVEARAERRAAPV